MKTQTMEIAEKLDYNARRRFYELVKLYEEKPYPSIVRKLEEYGMVIDEKDYGADQNVTK